jgi:hypothetical protein
MTDRERFIDWLLPDAAASSQRNPKWTELDPEVGALLHEVSCQSGVPLVWLADAAGLVVDGLAGLQCLWFLHGASGQVKTKGETESREWVFDALRAPKAAAAKKLRKQIERSGSDGGGSLNIDVRWSEGIVHEEQYATEADWMARRPSKVRTTKLGKWLRKHGASSELRHAFETRELPIWEWRISADPLDVLTMSFRRPWTSCMRPPDFAQDTFKEAGEAQYGPLTDMAAGAAILFWYRPGASQPCGRMVLRPALDRDFNEPTILWPGERAYGCGPTISAIDLQEMLAPSLPEEMVVTAQYLCQLGSYGLALSRRVYSDVDNEFCGQSDESYLDAYGELGTAPWPEPKYAGHEMRSVAVRWRGELDTVTDDGSMFGMFDMGELVAKTTNAVLALQSLSEIFQGLRDYSREPNLAAINRKALQGIEPLAAGNDDVFWDVDAGVRLALVEFLKWATEDAPTDVFAINNDKALAAEVRRAQDVFGGHVIWPGDFHREEGGASLLVPLGLERDDAGTWHTPEGAPVAMLVLVSQAMQPIYTDLPDLAAARVELPPGAWPWDFEER